MRRRRFITAAGGTSLLGLSGCLSSGGNSPTSGGNGPMRGSNSDCVISDSTDNVEPVSVTADGRLRGADFVLDIRWNARTQATIDTSEDRYYEPSSEDTRILVVRVEISNTTDSPAEIQTSSLGLKRETPNAVMDDLETPFGISGYTEGLDDMTLKSGGTVNRVILFRVEDPNVTSVTIQPRPITETERQFAESEDDLRTTLAFNPTCDESLEINAPPHQ